VSAARAAPTGCLSCHEGIERFSDGAMQDTIEAMGADLGDAGGCVVCHGGDPAATTAEAAHEGAPKDLTEAGGPQRFYRDPGSVSIARGNPFGNVVKKGRRVVLHSAGGFDFDVPVLKRIATDEGWRNSAGKVAMTSVATHMDSMECYACHADWAPQCYGCHITVD
jgi:hypothetical protein